MTRSRRTSSESGERIPWIHVGVFLAGTVLVVLFTSHQIATERETALTHWKSRLATIAADRTRLVSGWLAARRADAEVLAAFPAVRAQLAGQGRDDEALARHLSRVAAAYGYVGIVVADPAGRAAARSVSDAGLAAALLDQAAEHAAEVARSRKPRYELVGEGAAWLLVVTVPVFSDGAPAGLDGDTRPLLVSSRSRPNRKPASTRSSRTTRSRRTRARRSWWTSRPSLPSSSPRCASPSRPTPRSRSARSAAWA